MVLRNQKGQMAIFIALFFQVLFVFFAMAINVGLVVHDKINLQNAVDLAAYYGAAKQAEVLNQMAHINYQMRQNFKLLVWRYRVLGSLGLDVHPLGTALGASSQWLQDQDVNLVSTNFKPSVCVAHRTWQEYTDLDGPSNMCRTVDLYLQNIQPAGGGTGFVPGYSGLVSYTQMANASLAQNCLESSILNWMLAARWLVHFRVDGLVRKNKMLRLANNLTQSDPLDIRNESIREGVRKTFENNLTNSNASGIVNFQYFNSLSQGQCSDPSFWLPEIKINPVLRFTNLETQGANNNCQSTAVPNRPVPGRTPILGQTSLPSGLGNPSLQGVYLGSVQEMISHWVTEPTNELHSSIGFEKNPWCLVYSGVRATTQVRKPFSPAGAVTLEARGYAQPFGGRLGPWYGRDWPAGNPNSVANSRSQMVDPQLPSRDIAGAAPSLNPDDDDVNYSRYPGDTLGLRSARAITAMQNAFRASIQMPPPNSTQAPLAWRSYDHLGGRPNMEATGDSLARDTPSKPALHRRFELGAVAPDAFDILYYSIEPHYFSNYFTPQATNDGAAFAPNEKIFDFGSSKDGVQPNSSPQFTVIDQIQNAATVYDPEVNYVVRNWHHLLSSWHQSDENIFELDPGQFGVCLEEVSNPEFPTTGHCVGGGRTGYSVKSVSRNFLISTDHELGGASGGAAAILNPPTF